MAVKKSAEKAAVKEAVARLEKGVASKSKPSSNSATDR